MTEKKIKQLAEDLQEKADEYAIEFMEWTNNNYTLVHSKEQDVSAYVHIDNGVLIHGSDYHYTKLINEHGKTATEILEEFKQKHPQYR